MQAEPNSGAKIKRQEEYTKTNNQNTKETRCKAQGTRTKIQGTRAKFQGKGTRRKTQGTRTKNPRKKINTVGHNLELQNHRTGFKKLIITSHTHIDRRTNPQLHSRPYCLLITGYHIYTKETKNIF